MQIRQGKVAVLLAVLMAASACANLGATHGTMQPPQVTLERVEVASYFPYAAPPARVPLVLAFIYAIENPNDFAVALEEMKFTVSFEAKPAEYFPLATPTVYEKMYVPGKHSNQLRVTTVLDSLVVPGNLAVTSGARVTALDLKPADVVKMWWEKIGDFSFGIKVDEGVAMIEGPGGTQVVSFAGTFPKP